MELLWHALIGGRESLGNDNILSKKRKIQKTVFSITSEAGGKQKVS